VRYFWRDKGPSYIERYIQGRHVLDIGCGSGFVLKQLPARYIPYGIEIDAEAARRAERYAAGRGGYVVHCDALSGLARLSDQWIDGVLMQSFLEHENQPLPVLRHVRRVLRPGGRVIIKVPNLASWNRLVRQQRWCGFRFPDHVNYFTPDSLTRMVGTAGLDIARFGLLQRQPTSDNMWLVAERPTDPAIGRSAA
jgi:SAM-dependent methyltransferase